MPMHVDTTIMKEESGLHPSPQRMSRRHEHVAGRYQDMAKGITGDDNDATGVNADTQLRRAASIVSNKPA